MTLGHIAFCVTDMPATLAFYEKALGIHKAFSLADPSTGAPWIEYLLVAPGQFIELFYGGNAPAAVQGNPAGFGHLCLAVDDINAAAARVREAGYPLIGGPSQGCDGNWQVWTADPDGVRIELMQIMPDSPQDVASRK